MPTKQIRPAGVCRLSLTSTEGRNGRAIDVLDGKLWPGDWQRGAAFHKEMIGHTSIILTHDTYSHILPDIRQEAAVQIAGLFEVVSLVPSVSSIKIETWTRTANWKAFVRGESPLIEG